MFGRSDYSGILHVESLQQVSNIEGLVETDSAFLHVSIHGHTEAPLEVGARAKYELAADHLQNALPLFGIVVAHDAVIYPCGDENDMAGLVVDHGEQTCVGLGLLESAFKESFHECDVPELRSLFQSVDAALQAEDIGGLEFSPFLSEKGDKEVLPSFWEFLIEWNIELPLKESGLEVEVPHLEAETP